MTTGKRYKMPGCMTMYLILIALWFTLYVGKTMIVAWKDGHDKESIASKLRTHSQHVKDYLIKTGIASNPSRMIHGKIVVVDLDRKDIDFKISSQINERILAFTPNDVSTIVLLHRSKENTNNSYVKTTYQNGKNKGSSAGTLMACRCDVALIDIQSKETTYTETFYEPDIVINTGNVSELSRCDLDDDIVTFINSLPITPN